MNFPQEFFDWININKTVSPDKLRLKYLSKDNSLWWYNIAIDHIQSLKKACSKLQKGENSLCPEILFPAIAAEQCSSYDTAILHAEIIENIVCKKNANILDLTCGLGIDTAALAKRNFNITAIEENETIYQIGKYNYRCYSNIKLINANCVEYLKQNNSQYDAVYIDPARRNFVGKKIADITQCSPNIYEILPLLIHRTSHVFVKLSPMIDIKKLLFDLPKINKLFVVESKGECKELFVYINLKGHQINPLNIRIEAIGGNYKFCYTLNEEHEAAKHMIFRMPVEDNVLYLPSPGIMKCGCFNLLCFKFEVSAIAKDSHLYVSESEIMDFPGKAFKIIKVFNWQSQILKKIKTGIPAAEIRTRNFLMPAEKLRHKLGLKPSSEFYIFATTNENTKPILIYCQAINSTN